MAVDHVLLPAYCGAMPTLLEQIRELSTEEKYELLDVICQEIGSQPYTLTQQQEAELDRRLEEHRQDPGDVVPWEEVKARLGLR